MLNVLKENNYWSRILSSKKTPFRNEGKIKTFSYKQKQICNQQSYTKWKAKGILQVQRKRAEMEENKDARRNEEWKTEYMTEAKWLLNV